MKNVSKRFYFLLLCSIFLRSSFCLASVEYVPGLAYCKAMKDSGGCDEWSEDDYVHFVAKYNALSELYGEKKARNLMEFECQTKMAESQSWCGRWGIQTIVKIFVQVRETIALIENHMEISNSVEPNNWTWNDFDKLEFARSTCSLSPYYLKELWVFYACEIDFNDVQPRGSNSLGDIRDEANNDDESYKLVQEYVNNLDEAFRCNRVLSKEEMKGRFVPISAKLEITNDREAYIVIGAVDCFVGDASFPIWSQSEETFNEMKDAHKKDWSGRIEGSEGMMYNAYHGNCGFALRLYNYEGTDSCTFYYGEGEVREMYQTAKEYVENGGDLMIKNTNTDRFDIGDYTIEIPKTMYLSGDNSFDIAYNFWTKDESKYARIQVKIEEAEDAVEIAEAYNEVSSIPVDVAMEFRKEIRDLFEENGMKISLMYGPDFVRVSGDNIYHFGYIRDDPMPTRVDTYQFFVKNKDYVITTSYRINEQEEWDEVLRQSVLSVRKK